MPFQSTYLGDAVYATYDGFGIWLTTESHDADEATNKIYLEPAVYNALITFRDSHRPQTPSSE